MTYRALTYHFFILQRAELDVTFAELVEFIESIDVDFAEIKDFAVLAILRVN